MRIARSASALVVLGLALPISPARANVGFNASVVNASSRRCLADPAGSLTAGTTMIQWDCNNGRDQVWVFNPYPSQTSTTYEVINLKSNMCLAVSAAGTADDTPIIQWPCTGGLEQRWRLTAAGGGAFHLQPGHAFARCAQPRFGSVANGAEVRQYVCRDNSPTLYQDWILGSGVAL